MRPGFWCLITESGFNHIYCSLKMYESEAANPLLQMFCFSFFWLFFFLSCADFYIRTTGSSIPFMEDRKRRLEQSEFLIGVLLKKKKKIIKWRSKNKL